MILCHAPRLTRNHGTSGGLIGKEHPYRVSWTDGARRQPSWISISPQGPFLPDVDGYPGLGLSSSGFLPRPGSSHGRTGVYPARHRICRRQYSVPLGSTNRVRFSGGGRLDLAPNHAFGAGATRRPFYNRNDLSNGPAPKCRAIFRLRRLDVAMGKVKRFNATKGFGFIQPDTGGKDVFVHISAVEKAGLSNLNEGVKVSYDIVSDRGKESAGNLKVK